ncbi:hypothetical protein ACEWY4_020063 [Coilia grayii]|uniref:Uncharacterized protein n=1 Tax=Coilia grayii TaxID=363190 RepID=A0ABD1JBK1_9TELE
MERMILNLGDDAVIRRKIEQLLSSGALRPLTDMLVDRLQHIISQYDPVKPTEIPNTSVSGPMFPEQKYMFAIVKRSLRPFLRQLMADVLSQLTEDSQEGTFTSVISCSQTAIKGINLNLLITTMAQEVMNTLSCRPRDSPASPTVSRPGDQEYVKNCKVMVCKEREYTTSLISEGNDYFSLVSTVLMQLLTRIEPTTMDLADFTAFHSGLTDRILTEFYSASGLSKNEAHYPAVSIQRICDNIYNELLEAFRTKAMIHGLLVYRQPVLSTVLTQSLVRELLQVCLEGFDAEGQQMFSFLHRLKVNGTLVDALKSLIGKGNTKVQPMFTEDTDAKSCDEDEGDSCLETSECSSTASSSGEGESRSPDLFSSMLKTFRTVLSKNRVTPMSV